MIYRKPIRIFESTGHVNPEEAYYIQLENVTNSRKQDIKSMVDMGRYFSIFAPRQSGKTTFLKTICSQLHDDPVYAVILLSFQKYRKLDKTRFYELVENGLYSQLLNRLQAVKCEKIEEVSQFLENYHLTDHISFSLLFEKLNQVIHSKKITIFIDEFDGIPFSELENFLTAIRDLYQDYKGVKKKALYSVGLIGIRNITKLVVGGVSPFNIADQVELPLFSLENVRDLFSQYTGETNQPFTEPAVKKIYEETAGQPWLVNRLGTILTVDVKPGTVQPIDEKDVEEAVQRLLIERNDHFDNLYEKAKMYKETFVKIVFDNVGYNPGNEDQTCLEQHGLIKKKDKKAVVANSIYKDRFTRIFFDEIKVPEDISPSDYLLSGDLLDMENVLLDFEQYISRIGVRAFYQGDKPYEKTGQFLLTAWLYQFVKSGAGEIRYEVNSGLGRRDIILIYKGKKYIIETKVNHGNLKRTISKAIIQLSTKYLASEFLSQGYLVIFDTKTLIGEGGEPQHRRENGKTVTIFIIGIKKV